MLSTMMTPQTANQAPGGTIGENSAPDCSVVGESQSKTSDDTG